VRTLLLISMLFAVTMFVNGVTSFTPFSSITASAQDEPEPTPEPEPAPEPAM
jgi:hypothetical protein